MRETKFRLILRNEIVGYEKWYSGSYSESEGWKVHPLWLTSKDNGNSWSPTAIFHNHKNQFTGLLDRNGKEIYEGDIVCLKTKSWNNEKDCSCWKKEIVWISCLNLACTKAYFDLETKRNWDNGHSYEDYSDDWELIDNKEVIGNIYSNPELLEAK